MFTLYQIIAHYAYVHLIAFGHIMCLPPLSPLRGAAAPRPFVRGDGGAGTTMSFSLSKCPLCASAVRSQQNWCMRCAHAQGVHEEAERRHRDRSMVHAASREAPRSTWGVVRASRSGSCGVLGSSSVRGAVACRERSPRSGARRRFLRFLARDFCMMVPVFMLGWCCYARVIVGVV